MPKTEVFNKEIVLNQASHVFHTKGYNAASMQDLVDATGLNRSSIYNSFGNKHNLFLECLKVYQNKYQRSISNLLLKANCPLKAIESIFELYLEEIVKDNDNKGCLITNCKSEMANQDSTINNFLINNQESTLALFEDLVNQGQENSSINRNRTPKDYALYLFTAIQGFRMTGILIDNKQQLQSLINTTLQNLK
ncbi:TetR/AcrR family transcriptional regulator [uncultured Winogradskyella sp.]|uniref:TetR/AcrR family transcriptional regulator n=1 Tax=uncultured Winogradskyella sp. TaxID=395353 RepID=UPI00260D9861|nr:TetR/AcrR family transcriptional regulator [uncultured Winogradskyella sp.]